MPDFYEARQGRRKHISLLRQIEISRNCSLKAKTILLKDGETPKRSKALKGNGGKTNGLGSSALSSTRTALMLLVLLRPIQSNIILGLAPKKRSELAGSPGHLIGGRP